MSHLSMCLRLRSSACNAGNAWCGTHTNVFQSMGASHLVTLNIGAGVDRGTSCV